MGLAAGQARLLTITARKSDCEFQSMRLSHQKISLARELADLSNEYQNSLNQTTLIYDYNGTGDTSMQFNYGIMMQPSQLNNYMPMMLTDSSNRVVLNSKYAAAARNAGIPQEGLGTLPSEAVRNKFIQELNGQGIILDDLSARIQGLPYNQNAGFGGDVTVVTRTEEVTYSELCQKLADINIPIANRTLNVPNEKGDIETPYVHTKQTDGNHITEVNLSNLLLANGDQDTKNAYLYYEGPRGECSPIAGCLAMQEMLTEPNGILEQMYKAFSSILATDDGGISDLALQYAYEQTKNLIISPETTRKPNQNYAEIRQEWWHEVGNAGKDYDERSQYGDEDHDDVGTAGNSNPGVAGKYHAKDLLNPVGTFVGGETKEEDQNKMGTGDVVEQVQTMNSHFVGFLFSAENKKDPNKSNISINLNNIAKAFLTYYTIMVNGVDNNKNADGSTKYMVGVGACDAFQDNSPQHSKLVGTEAKYTIKLGTDISSDDLALATFYDAMFNQICANGWVENEQVNDPNYLQQMLQSGMMFISKIKDDNYYYQANYATDTYIKEIADEKLIAKAEAKYNTEKAKLNAKEETLDLKMKNLDTEISSLTTEYDTVKNTISKNIEKSFKRYNA